MKKVQKKFEKKFEKMFEKKFAKKFENITNCRRKGGREGGREGGWRIVIPMPEAINFVDGRRQKYDEYLPSLFLTLVLEDRYENLWVWVREK
jgi:hypothetical protein